MRFREPVPEVRWEPEIRGRLIVAYGLVRYQKINFERFISYIKNRALVMSFARMGVEEEAHASELASLFDPTEGPLERILTHEMAAVSDLVELAQQIGDGAVKGILDRMIIDHASYAAAFFALRPSEEFGYRQLLGDLALKPRVGVPEEVSAAMELASPRFGRGTVDPTTLAGIATAVAIESLLIEELRHVMKVFHDKETREVCAWFAIACADHIAMLNYLEYPEKTPLERAISSEVAEVSGLERALKACEDPRAEAAITLILNENRAHLDRLEGSFRKLEGGEPGRLAELPPRRRPTVTVTDYISQVADKFGIERAA